MLSAEDNRLLTQCGPQTAMGDLVRRYWLPFLLARELEPDGAPLRVRLLGENLIAFRGTDGAVALVDDDDAIVDAGDSTGKICDGHHRRSVQVLPAAVPSSGVIQGRTA